MTQYIALVHKNGHKGYGVSFPDFPGCVSAGNTIENALRSAAEALAFHVDGMREDRQRIPKPRSMESIREAREDWIDLKDAIVATVPVLPAQNKTVRVQLTIDQRLLARIDAVAENRSAFLSQAALQILEKATSHSSVSSLRDILKKSSRNRKLADELIKERRTEAARE